MMDKQITERMAVVENRLDQHDERLDKHGQRLDKLNLKNVEQDSLLTKLCQNLDKNSEITQRNHEMITEIHTQGKTIKWLVTSLVTGIPAVISLYFALKQIGVF